MRAFVFVVLFGVLIFAESCATTAKYDAKVSSWKGQDSATLVKAWGKPGDIQPLSSGNKMWVYPRLKHPPVAYAGSQRAIASVEDDPTAKSVYVKCATYFEVDPQGKIVSTLFRGNECKSSD